MCPKATGSKVVIEVLKTTIDVSDSAAHQYNDNGSVSLTEIVVDVATQKLGGEISKDLSLHSPSSINATERHRDRAQRVAAGDPASSGRASTAARLNKKLTNKKNANSAIQQGTSGAAANGMQALLEFNNSEVNIDLKPNLELNNPVKDNTNVIKPIFKFQ